MSSWSWWIAIILSAVLGVFLHVAFGRHLEARLDARRERRLRERQEKDAAFASRAELAAQYLPYYAVTLAPLVVGLLLQIGYIIILFGLITLFTVVGMAANSVLLYDMTLLLGVVGMVFILTLVRSFTKHSNIVFDFTAAVREAFVNSKKSSEEGTSDGTESSDNTDR